MNPDFDDTHLRFTGAILLVLVLVSTSLTAILLWSVFA